MLDVDAFRVDIPDEVKRVIRHLAAGSADGRETGGILLGRGPDQSGLIRVVEAGDPGPLAIRRPDFFSRDTAHSERLAERAWKRERAQWVGEWHTHPTTGPQPSGRDLTAYAEVLGDATLGFAVFVVVIVAPGPEGWGDATITSWVIAMQR